MFSSSFIAFNRMSEFTGTQSNIGPSDSKCWAEEIAHICSLRAGVQVTRLFLLYHKNQETCMSDWLSGSI